MKIINPSFELLTPIEVLKDQVKLIEKAGRVCYKSEDKITEDSAACFVNKLTKVHKHESVIEHGGFTVKFVCDRGVSHELVRHRVASYSQESTRYCNYSKDKFEAEISVIQPVFFKENTAAWHEWRIACQFAEKSYFELLNYGCPPEQARSVLPNSLKTEIVMTANFREWRHVFELRCAPNAHPQIRELMIPLRDKMLKHLPEIFE